MDTTKGRGAPDGASLPPQCASGALPTSAALPRGMRQPPRRSALLTPCQCPRDRLSLLVSHPAAPPRQQDGSEGSLQRRSTLRECKSQIGARVHALPGHTRTLRRHWRSGHDRRAGVESGRPAGVSRGDCSGRGVGAQWLLPARVCEDRQWKRGNDTDFPENRDSAGCPRMAGGWGACAGGRPAKGGGAPPTRSRLRPRRASSAAARPRAAYEVAAPARELPTSRGWGRSAASRSPCQYSSLLVLRYQSMVFLRPSSHSTFSTQPSAASLSLPM